MPYSAEISRSSPTAILFLIDQSASMQDPFGGARQKGDAAPSKARVLADVVNRLIQNLILRCAKEEGVRDYFHIGVVGYGDRVEPLLQMKGGQATSRQATRGRTTSGPTAGDQTTSGQTTTGQSEGGPTASGPAKGAHVEGGGALVPVAQLAERPLRLEERMKELPDPSGKPGASTRRVKVPVWFDPHAKNGTPMCQAVDLGAQIIRRWIDLHPRDFPPIVINVTDGEATDGDPLVYARQLKSFATDDGETLLFNVHLSSSDEPPLELPDAAAELPEEEYALQLFQMSSVLPFPMRAAAEREGYPVTLDTRGFVFNADPSALVRFLEIGTRPSTLR